VGSLGVGDGARGAVKVAAEGIMEFEAEGARLTTLRARDLVTAVIILGLRTPATPPSLLEEAPPP
jgi:hypothetical protein